MRVLSVHECFFFILGLRSIRSYASARCVVHVYGIGRSARRESLSFSRTKTLLAPESDGSAGATGPPRGFWHVSFWQFERRRARTILFFFLLFIFVPFDVHNAHIRVAPRCIITSIRRSAPSGPDGNRFRINVAWRATIPRDSLDVISLWRRFILFLFYFFQRRRRGECSFSRSTPPTRRGTANAITTTAGCGRGDLLKPTSIGRTTLRLNHNSSRRLHV